MKVNVKVLRRSLMVLLAFLIVAGVCWVIHLAVEYRKHSPVPASGIPVADQAESVLPEKENMLFYEGAWYAPKKQLNTVLIMGLDDQGALKETESYRNQRQVDFILLLVFDNEKKTVQGMQLNRDTMASIPMLGVTGKPAGSFQGQLALAYTYGDGARQSCQNAVKAVSDFLYGIQVDHYAALTMDAVPVLNDRVGGVSVSVSAEFAAAEPSVPSGESVLLNGEQAMTFLRARSSLTDSSNTGRMERQRQYLTGLAAQLRSAAEAQDDFIVGTVLELSPYLISDCSIDVLSDLSNEMLTYDNLGMLQPEGAAKQGEEFVEFYADAAALKKMVVELFYLPVAS